MLAILGHQFRQPYVQVTSGYVGRCASAPTHTDNNQTPVIFYVSKREGQGWRTGGSFWYNLQYGFGVPLQENTTIIFRARDLHGTAAFEEDVVATGLSLTTDERLVQAWDRRVRWFGGEAEWGAEKARKGKARAR